MQDLNGKWALITGASSGLGTDFARQLAARGVNLILVARRQARMQALKQEILKSANVDIDIITQDLVADGACARLFEKLKDKPVDILINNAGFGVYGRYGTRDWSDVRDMLALNVVVLSGLTKLFGDDMARRGTGYILQVASLAAYQPMPHYAAYAASKAYVLSLGEALHFELKPKGVVCTVLSPGITATEFAEVSGQKPTRYNRGVEMTSEAVVAIGLAAMLAGKSSVIAGVQNKIVAFAERFASRALAAKVAYRLMKNR